MKSNTLKILSVKHYYSSKNSIKKYNLSIILNITLNNEKLGESIIYNIPMTEIYWKVYDYALKFIQSTCHGVNGYMFKKMFNIIPSHYSGFIDFNDVKKFIQFDPITKSYILHEEVKLVKH